MISLQTTLTTYLSDAFETYGVEREFGKVVISQRPELSQFQCNGALAAANQQGQPPRALAQEIVETLQSKHTIFEAVDLAGPGFINLTISDKFLANHIEKMYQDERLGCPEWAAGKSVVVDFGGPNIAKPMHVGHLRSTIIGDCLQRLYRFMGARVISDIHLGDWGRPIGMLICELKELHPYLPYFDPNFSGPYPAESPVTIADLQALYPQADTRCKNDPEAMDAALKATFELQQGHPGYHALWQHFRDVSHAALKTDFDNLGVSFDFWLGESYYQPQMPQLLADLEQKNQAYLSDGALIIAFDSEKHPNLPPLILEKSDGGYLYATTDLATIAQRVEDFQPTDILYVVDARQSLHFKQLFQATDQTGLTEDVTLTHVAFGTVNGPDGKPFKTRAGGVMQLQALIEMMTNEAMNPYLKFCESLECDRM